MPLYKPVIAIDTDIRYFDNKITKDAIIFGPENIKINSLKK